MDTREKIIPLDAAANIAREQKMQALAGRFDPLLAEHARRIAELSDSQPLLVFVLDYDGAILPAAARAELVAALKSVRYVSIADTSALEELSAGFSIVREDEHDVERQKQLLEHIRRREHTTRSPQ